MSADLRAPILVTLGDRGLALIDRSGASSPAQAFDTLIRSCQGAHRADVGESNP